MTHDETLARIKPILTDHVKAAHAAVDVAINAVRLDDRERIAELERDLAHARANVSRGKTLVAEGVSVIEELQANLAQNAAITEALRAENERLRGKLAVSTGIAFEEDEESETPVVEEEQGPWVIRTKLGRYESTSKWKLAAKADDAMTFESKEAAFQRIYGYRPDEWDSHQFPLTVITLAEAHRIAGDK